MSGQFEGRGAVVTGAARGIGLAVTSAFAAEGAGVVAVDAQADVLHEAIGALDEDSGMVRACVADVAVRNDVRRAVQECVDAFGRLDVMVQVAGIAEFVPFLEVTDSSWNRILDVNLRGTWYCVQEAGRRMVADGSGGAIVVTSSTNAFQPEAGGLAYNTSKAGQVAVMRTAAMELAPHGIRVNGIAPGIVNTRLSHFVINDPVQSIVFRSRIPLDRFAEAAEMARPILWMCSDDASYLSGHLMVVDGAMTAGLPVPGNPADLPELI